MFESWSVRLRKSMPWSFSLCFSICCLYQFTVCTSTVAWSFRIRFLGCLWVSFICVPMSDSFMWRPEVSLCSWFFFCRFVLLLFASTTSQSYWSVSLRHKRRQILQNDHLIVSLNYSRLSSYNSSLSSSILMKDPVEKVWSSPSTIWRSKVLSRSSLSSEETSWSKHLNISLRHFRIWIHASFF